MSDLEIKVTRHYCSLDAVPSGSGKDVAVISLKGIMDSLARKELEQTAKDLLAENIVHYIFDLAEVTRGESTGIGFLIKLAAEVYGRSGGVVVVGASERLKAACDLIGLWSYVALADDLEHALKLVLNESHRRI